MSKQKLELLNGPLETMARLLRHRCHIVRLLKGPVFTVIKGFSKV